MAFLPSHLFFSLLSFFVWLDVMCPRSCFVVIFLLRVSFSVFYAPMSSLFSVCCFDACPFSYCVGSFILLACSYCVVGSYVLCSARLSRLSVSNCLASCTVSSRINVFPFFILPIICLMVGLFVVCVWRLFLICLCLICVCACALCLCQSLFMSLLVSPSLSVLQRPFS